MQTIGLLITRIACLVQLSKFYCSFLPRHEARVLLQRLFLKNLACALATTAEKLNSVRAELGAKVEFSARDAQVYWYIHQSDHSHAAYLTEEWTLFGYMLDFLLSILFKINAFKREKATNVYFFM